MAFLFPLLVALLLIFLFFNEPFFALLTAAALVIYVVFSSKAVQEDLGREYDEMEKTKPNPPTYDDVEEHLDDLNEMLFEEEDKKKGRKTSLEKLEEGTERAGKRAKGLFKN